MPSLTRLVPILATESLQETVDFYTQKLGFRCLHLDEDLGWASVDNAGVFLIFPAQYPPAL